MSNRLNEVGKILGKVGSNANFLLNRVGLRNPQIESARDTFYANRPFELYFRMLNSDSKVFINLDISLHECLILNVEGTGFINNTTPGLPRVAYVLPDPYVPGTVTLTINGDSSQIEETDPSAGVVTIVYFGQFGNYTICYEPVAQAVQLFLDEVDVTEWTFGQSTIVPTDFLHTWENIDITELLDQQAGIHILSLVPRTAGYALVKVEIR